MDNIYALFKAFLDPIVFVLIFIITGFLVSLRSEKKKSARIFLLIAFFILYVTSISPVSNGLSYFLEKKYLSKDNNTIGNLDVVTVLGGGISENKYVKETMQSHETASRLFYAVWVFRNSRAKYLVCVGKGSGKLSEAEVMEIAAVRLGVPATKIKIDPKSRNTREHAVEFNKMFNDKNIYVGLVTSAYHMKRSEREFRKYFPNIFPFPSDYLYSSSALSVFTFLPSSYNLYISSLVLREIAGITWYKLRGQ